MNSWQTLFVSTAAILFIAAGPATPFVRADVNEDLDRAAAAIVDQVKQGNRTEEGLASELQAFDELVEKYKDEPESAASVLTLKAFVFVQLLGRIDQGVALLKKVIVDYPGTKAAIENEQIIEELTRFAEAQKRQEALVIGSAFPEFTETGLNGESLSLPDYRGKIVLIDFWATWCQPCVQELPNVKDTYDRHHAEGFEIIGISLDKDRATLEDFLKRQKISWPQVFDGKAWETKLARYYGVSSIPATYLLDQNGMIIGKDLRGSDLERTVAEVLAQ